MIEIKKLLQGRSGSGGRIHRAAGDAARDRKDWLAAESAYSRHLSASPDDQPIWVQFGHALKEQRRFREAEAAYRRAIALDPHDSDAQFQLGTALSRLGDHVGARDAYQTALNITPTKAAYDALVALGSADDDDGVLPSVFDHDERESIYLEVDDLLDYLRGYTTLSGIQRVQVGIVDFALKKMRNHRHPYAFVRAGKHAVGFWKLDPSDLAQITAYVSQATVSGDKLRALIELAEQRATRVAPGPGQIYFVLGAFWGFGSNAARYTRLKIAGVLIGVYLYDLIPMTNPEYCASDLVSEFSYALSDGLHVFDFVLTISQFVEQEVKALQTKHRLRTVPVEAVLLAHQLSDRPEGLRQAIWTDRVAPLKNRSYVLMVSTIEARKNHIYLYNIWKTLLDEGLDLPDLVLVGRFGWRVNDFRDVLEGTGYLGNRIHILHDLSDADLDLLYKNCIFTAFPSIVEGWGLPVGESLAYGKPCIASRTSSIPEVGGDLVDYVDPWNVRDGIAVFRRLLFDEEYRTARTKEIKDRFVARNWDQVGQELLARIEAFRTRGVVSYLPPLLAAAELFIPGQLVVGTIMPPNYPSRPLRQIVADGWYPIEPFGTWMRGREGSLWFSTRSKPGTRLTLYLQLTGAPWSHEHFVNLEIDGSTGNTERPPAFPSSVSKSANTFRITPKNDFLARVSGFVGQDGTVLIRLRVKGETINSHPDKPIQEERIFHVGLVKLAYAETSDTELRLDMMEHFASR